MHAEDWQRDHDGGSAPKFGRKALAWLRHKLRETLFVALPTGWHRQVRGKHKTEWDSRAVDDLLDSYMADAMRYVEWQADDQYRGRSFSNGAWVLNSRNVIVDWSRHVDAADRQIDARKCETLDAWLKADLEGRLWYGGDPGGAGRIDPDARAAFLKSRCRSRAQADPVDERPKVACRCCDHRFTADRSNAAYCPACRALNPRERRALERELRESRFQTSHE